MIRLASVFWVLLVSATALATFGVKYEVQALDDRLVAAKKASASETREMRVLDAEWAYLNRPDTLAAMNQRFLSLAPITRRQLGTAIADIPMRPPPPTPAPPQPAPETVTVPETGSVVALEAPLPKATALDASSPKEASVATAAPDRPAMPQKLAMAATPVKPLLVKAPVRASAVPPRRPLDNHSLDQLIARIAAAR